jgi:L-lactate utilization protein LutC
MISEISNIKFEFMEYSQLASPELISRAKIGLEAAGYTVYVVDNADQAKSQVESLLIQGSSVMQMVSETLEATGITQLINESGNYDSVKNKLHNPELNLSETEKKALGYAHDFAVGSAHAITTQGEILVASNTGSQQGAYTYGADKVIFVIGTQKLVENLAQAMDRVYNYVLPLESQRVQKAYGMEHSNVSKLLIINKETVPNRIHVILVKQNLGF